MAKPTFSTDQYVSALSAALRNATPKQLEILQAHFDAPKHTASAQQLAAIVGYSSFGPVNIEYSKFARRAAEALAY